MIERRFGNETQIAASGGAGVLGVIRGQLREIGARVDFLDQHGGFASGFGFVSGLVVLAVVNGGVRARRDDDLRDVILRLGHIKLRAVLVVEIGRCPDR